MVNFFLVHPDPVKAAGQLNDKHVVKMVLETAQLLSWIVWNYVPDKAKQWCEARLLGNAGIYAAASKGHAKHPVLLWMKKHRNNWNIAVKHGVSLCEEYTKRYGRVHKSQAVIEFCRDNFVEGEDGNMPSDQTQPVQRSPAHNPHGVTLPLPQCFGKSWTHLRRDAFRGATADDSVLPAVVAYRDYYVKDKARFSRWTSPAKEPKWFTKRMRTAEQAEIAVPVS